MYCDVKAATRIFININIIVYHLTGHALARGGGSGEMPIQLSFLTHQEFLGELRGYNWVWSTPQRFRHTYGYGGEDG